MRFVTRHPILTVILLTVIASCLCGAGTVGNWYHQFFVAVFRGVVAFLRGVF